MKNVTNFQILKWTFVGENIYRDQDCRLTTIDTDTIYYKFWDSKLLLFYLSLCTMNLSIIYRPIFRYFQ